MGHTRLRVIVSAMAASRITSAMARPGGFGRGPASRCSARQRPMRTMT